MRFVASSLMTALLVAGCVSGCKKKEAAPPQAGSAHVGSGSAQVGSGSAAGSAAGSGDGSAAGSSDGSAAGSGDGSAAATGMANKGGNCPAMVATAKSVAELKDGALTLTISSENKDAVAVIQKRTKDLLAARAGEHTAGGTTHDQKGTQGGNNGICPVISTMDAKATDSANGVVIAFSPKPNVRMDLAATKAEIDERIKKSEAFVAANFTAADGAGHGGGVGGGKGDDGSNHSGQGDGKGKTRDTAAGSAAGSAGSGGGGGKGTGGGGGDGTGGGGGKGTGGGGGKGSAAN